jgi:hypothetical protein
VLSLVIKLGLIIQLQIGDKIIRNNSKYDDYFILIGFVS